MFKHGQTIIITQAYIVKYLEVAVGVKVPDATYAGGYVAGERYWVDHFDRGNGRLYIKDSALDPYNTSINVGDGLGELLEIAE